MPPQTMAYSFAKFERTRVVSTVHALSSTIYLRITNTARGFVEDCFGESAIQGSAEYSVDTRNAPRRIHSGGPNSLWAPNHSVHCLRWIRNSDVLLDGVR